MTSQHTPASVTRQSNAANGVSAPAADSARATKPEGASPAVAEKATAAAAAAASALNEKTNGIADKEPTEQELRDQTVAKLYAGQPCTICGLRFAAGAETKELDDHLNRHFERKRRKKALAERTASRMWFSSTDAWVQLELKGAEQNQVVGGCYFDIQEKLQEEADQKEKEEQLSVQVSGVAPGVEVDEQQCACDVCGERFDRQQWELPGSGGYETVWIYSQSMRHNGVIVHRDCYEASADTPRGAEEFSHSSASFDDDNIAASSSGPSPPVERTAKRKLDSGIVETSDAIIDVAAADGAASVDGAGDDAAVEESQAKRAKAAHTSLN